MRKLPVLFLLGLISFIPAAYAQQKSSGDYFTDQGFYVDDRPLGLSAQRFHHSDMFGPPHMYMNSRKDMFDHAKPSWDFGNQDMFSSSLHRKDVPEEPLFQWPRNKQ